MRLPGLPGSDEFNKVYYACLDGTYAENAHGPKLSTKGTFRWLSEQYFGSAEFKQLDGRTQHVRRQILEACWQEPIKPGATRTFDDMPLSAFNSKAVRTLRDRKVEAPEAANSRVKAIRQVFSWAVKPDVELAELNPARDVSYFRSQTDGFHSWSQEEVEQFEENYPIGTKARLALALLLYTSQRRSDVVLFGKQHVRNGWLRFTQQKNRNRNAVSLEIPIHPKLQQVIDASPCGDLTFLVTDLGRPFTANGFGNKMREWCDKAGLPQCSAHGLRKAAASRLADRGASEKQIMSVTGHQTSKEVTRYTKAAQQKKLAEAAMALIEAEEPEVE